MSLPQNWVFYPGDVYTVCDDPDQPVIGHEIWPNRPAVVLSSETISQRTNVVTIVYLTSTASSPPAPTRIPVKMPQQLSYAICEQITTVDTRRLVQRIHQLSSRQLDAIRAGVGLALALPNNEKTLKGVFYKWEQMVKSQRIPWAEMIATETARITPNSTSALHKVQEERDMYKKLYEKEIYDKYLLSDSVMSNSEKKAVEHHRAEKSARQTGRQHPVKRKK